MPGAALVCVDTQASNAALQTGSETGRHHQVEALLLMPSLHLSNPLSQASSD